MAAAPTDRRTSTTTRGRRHRLSRPRTCEPSQGEAFAGRVEPSPHQFAAHLHWVCVDDAVIILDARRGEYFGLDVEASRQWLRLAGSGDPAGDGMDDLVAAVHRRGWLTAPRQDRTRPARRRGRAAARAWRPFSVPGAYVCLAQAFILVRLRGFARAYDWAGSLARRPVVSGSDATALALAMKAFLRAEHFMLSRLGPDDCLPRSLALFAFLRRCGIPACHRIGVRRYPFAAHAWVEHRADLVLDWPERVSEFTPIVTIS